jgi:shikimate dehydrogenase
MAQNFRQELVGCFGQPVDENPTQPMIEAAFRHHGLDWRYLTIEVAPRDLAAAVAGARAMGFRGFNCTIPHKLAVIPHLDGLGESAALIGAVNCVVARDGRLIGENTDGKGFVAGVSRLADPAGKRMVLLGAGGAARAIAVEMALVGVRHIIVVSRDAAQGKALVDLLGGKVRDVAGGGVSAELAAWDGDYAVPAGTDIVVNATPIGLYPDVDAGLDLAVGSLAPGMIAVDVIPNPPRTRFVRDAQARGCAVVDGLAMLVGQGRIGIEYWTGIDPDETVMRAALEEVFRAEPSA